MIIQSNKLALFTLCNRLLSFSLEFESCNLHLIH